MIEIRYKDCSIQPLIVKKAGGWTVEKIMITSSDSSGVTVKTLTPPERIFPTEEEARDFAFTYGKQWIDNNRR